MAKKRQHGLTLSALKSRLAQGKIAPVHLIAGNESFLADEAVRSVAEAITSRDGEVSHSFHHGDEAGLASVLDDVRTLRLFSPCLRYSGRVPTLDTWATLHRLPYTTAGME